MITVTFLLVNENGILPYNLAFKAAFWFSRLWGRHVFVQIISYFMNQRHKSQGANLNDHKQQKQYLQCYSIDDMHAPSETKVQTDKTDVFQQFSFESRFHFCSSTNGRVFNCTVMCKLHVLWKTKEKWMLNCDLMCLVNVNVFWNIKWGGYGNLT